MTRPEYVPETFWDPATNSVKTQEFTTHIGELAALKAQHDARLAARPPEPSGYQLKLPDDFKPDVAVAFDETDPRVALIRDFAHKNNWTQADFSEALKIEHAKVTAETKAYETRQAEEVKKLGTNGPARVTATKAWLAGILGTDGADAFMDRMLLAADIEALEKMQTAFTTQGGSTYSGNGREPPAPPPTTMEDRWYGQRKAS